MKQNFHKRTLSTFLAACLAFSAVFAMANVTTAYAEPTNFSFTPSNAEASLTLPLSTNEIPYNGDVHAWGFIVGDNDCRIVLNYNGDYATVADNIFYDEDSDTEIISAENLDNFFFEIHPSSTVSLSDFDNLRLIVNGKKYKFDEGWRVYLSDIPSALTYTFGMGTAQSRQTVKITNPKNGTKTYKEGTFDKKAQSFQIKASAKTALSYKVSKVPISDAKKYISVNKKGKVTIKKGAPAGVYKITVTAKATTNYEKATATVKIRVKGARG